MTRETAENAKILLEKIALTKMAIEIYEHDSKYDDTTGALLSVHEALKEQYEKELEEL